MRTTLLYSTLVWSFLISHVGAANTIEQLKKSLLSNPQRTTVRETLADKLFNDRQYDEVIKVLAPYSNEISLESLTQLAASYGETGDSLNELRVLQVYVEKDPERFRSHYLIGVAYKKNAKLDEAAKSFRRAITYAPKHRPSYDNLLSIFLEKKQNYESRTLLNDMIRVFGAKKEFYNHLCRLLTAEGFLSDALATCKKAVGLNPSYPDNHIFLAQNYYNQDNKIAAERIFQTAARQFKNSDFVQYATGAYYLSEKNFPTSVRYLKEAVKIDSDSLRAQITLAQALFGANEYKEALKHFEISCKLDQSKETLVLLKNSAAQLRKDKNSEFSPLYDQKAALCRPL